MPMQVQGVEQEAMRRQVLSDIQDIIRMGLAQGKVAQPWVIRTLLSQCIWEEGEAPVVIPTPQVKVILAGQVQAAEGLFC